MITLIWQLGFPYKKGIQHDLKHPNAVGRRLVSQFTSERVVNLIGKPSNTDTHDKNHDQHESYKCAWHGE